MQGSPYLQPRYFKEVWCVTLRSDVFTPGNDSVFILKDAEWDLGPVSVGRSEENLHPPFPHPVRSQAPCHLSVWPIKNEILYIIIIY